MSRTALIQTTTANAKDLSNFSTVSSIAIVASEPTNTKLTYVFKADDGNWQKYDTSSSTWKDVATQSLTAESVVSEGNTTADVTALTSTALAAFVGKTVNIAVGMEMDADAEEAPSLTSITFAGETGATVTTKTVDSNAINLTDSGKPCEILSIDVNKTEESGGTVQVLASINDGSGWGDYAEYSTYVTSPATKATAIKFRAVLTAPTIGTSIAKIDSVSINHRTDGVAVFSEGTGVCVTKTYNFINPISRAHLMVKHPLVDDTEITAQIALRESPTTVKGEVLGTGTGATQTVTLKNTTGIASHGFVLYFDGEAQAASSYSFSPTDGQVTYTADSGVAVTADYIYNWSKETFVDMTHDTVYPDKDDNTLVDDQFDYIATKDDDPKGSVGTVRVSLTQKTGTEKDVALGIGTGEAQSYKLAHHAKEETITVSPSKATWKYKDSTDVLTVTAPAGEAVKVTYSWAARSNYLESIACIFNE